MSKPTRCTLNKSVTAMAMAAVLISPTSFAQTLEQAVASALETHPQIRQAFARFKASEEVVNQAKAGYLPTVNLNAGIGWEQTENPSTRRDALGGQHDEKVDLTRSEIGVSLRQMLFDGFRTSSEVDRTSFEASANQWALFATAEDKALEVTRAYLDYLKAEEVLSLAEKNLASHQEIYDAISESNKGGFAKASDLSQVTGRLARANSNLISARNNLFDARSTYRKIINTAPEDLRLPVPDADMLPASLEQLIVSAIDTHPTLRSAGSDIEAANAAREGAKSSYLPEFSVELSANWNDNVDGVDGSRPIDVGGETEEVMAMVRMSYNLFNGGADRARERETAYQIVEAREIRQMAHRDVEEGATLAWNAREFLKEQREFMRQHVEAAADTRDAYGQEFRLNARTLLDVLDSENELFEARRDYLTAEYDDIQAQYRIFNAMGQLLASLRVEAPQVWKGEEQYEGGVQ